MFVIYSCTYKDDALTKEIRTQLILRGEQQKNNEQNINKILTGYYLFYDTKLSFNQTKSCGSCHNPDLYFTDGYKRTIGFYGDVQQRNTPSLINSVF